MAELTKLRTQLEELQSVFSVIRAGGVDGIMLGDPGDERLYALTSADRPYRVIVDEMGDGAATVSESGILLYVNRRLSGLLGRGRRDLVGSDLSALVSQPDRPKLDDILACTAGQTRRAEINLTGSDGIGVPTLASATGLDIDGMLIRCLVVTDITDRQRGELEIARATAATAARSVDLERANSELTRSNGDLAQFAYAASHDLAEPLRTITGFADLLQQRYRGHFDATADEFFEFILSGTARMQQLIKDLMTFSRVGTSPKSLVLVDAQAVFDDVLADLHALVNQTGAAVSCRPLPMLLSDRTQLTQVFTNLMRNSLTFIDPGTTPQIAVRAERDGGSWRFILSDNGIGIQADFREVVFGIFKRLHTRDVYPGTGVGLAIVQKIVQGQGGNIWIEDNPGGGTQVVFTLPDSRRLMPLPPRDQHQIPLVAANDDRSTVTVVSPDFPADPNLAPILLVEDNPADIRLTREAFTAVGIPNRLDVVTDGYAALDYLRRTVTLGSPKRPALVLLDLNLPKLDGGKVLSAIKADATLRDIPVIVLTTSGAPSDVAAAYRQRANCYVVKPLVFTEFQAAIRNISEFWLGLVTLPPLGSRSENG